MSYFGNGGYNPYVASGFAPPPVYGAPGNMPPTIHVHTGGHHHGFLHELGHAWIGHHHHHHGHH